MPTPPNLILTRTHNQYPLFDFLTRHKPPILPHDIRHFHETIPIPHTPQCPLRLPRDILILRDPLPLQVPLHLLLLPLIHHIPERIPHELLRSRQIRHLAPHASLKRILDHPKRHLGRGTNGDPVLPAEGFGILGVVLDGAERRHEHAADEFRRGGEDGRWCAVEHLRGDGAVGAAGDVEGVVV